MNKKLKQGDSKMTLTQMFKSQKGFMAAYSVVCAMIGWCMAGVTYHWFG